MADTLSLTVTKADGTGVTIAATGTITVTETAPVPPPPLPANAEPTIPVNATVVNMLTSTAWSCKHDTGTPGDASGGSTYPAMAPDGTKNCRQYSFVNINKGGALNHANVMPNASAFNEFCYEACEMSENWANIACAEKDLEQVAADGTYVDMATQLDGWNGCVDITQNQKWVGTKVKANPTQRKPGVWYTTRIYVRNNGGGSVTYIGIYLSDTGQYYPLGITVQSQPSEKWGPNLLNQQLQYVGLGAGSVASQVFLRTLNIHCWKS